MHRVISSDYLPYSACSSTSASASSGRYTYTLNDVMAKSTCLRDVTYTHSLLEHLTRSSVDHSQRWRLYTTSAGSSNSSDHTQCEAVHRHWVTYPAPSSVTRLRHIR